MIRLDECVPGERSRSCGSSRPGILRLALCGFFFVAVGGASAQTHLPGAVMWQNMPLIALLNGFYTGSVSVDAAMSQGDMGLGAFADLDGEMMAVDRKIYQIRSDGVARRPAGASLLAYAQMTRFRSMQKIALPPGTSFDNIASVLAGYTAATNSTYAIRISGSFSQLQTRAPKLQQKPYPPFCEAVKTQAEFNLNGKEGVMVGFIGPPYISAIDSAGYHLHFIDKTGTRGGHVLSFKTARATSELELIDRIEVDTPRDPLFDKLSLAAVSVCK